MSAPIKELCQFLDAEGRRKFKNAYKSNIVREFGREYADEHKLVNILESKLFELFLSAHEDVGMSKNYFHTICTNAWETKEVDGDTQINFDRQYEIKSRDSHISN